MILVDTTPLVALCDRRDPYHAQALTHLDRLLPAELGTGEAVLAEVCFHLPLPAQRRRLHGAIDEFGITLLGSSGDITADIFTWLAKYGEHEPDWADAWLAVMTGRLARAKVWTYDKEFRTIWRQPSGKRIPLAI